MESQGQAEMGGTRMEFKNKDIVDIRKYGSGSGNVCDFEYKEEAEMGKIRMEENQDIGDIRKYGGWGGGGGGQYSKSIEMEMERG